MSLCCRNGTAENITKHAWFWPSQLGDKHFCAFYTSCFDPSIALSSLPRGIVLVLLLFVYTVYLGRVSRKVNFKCFGKSITWLSVNEFIIFSWSPHLYKFFFLGVNNSFKKFLFCPLISSCLGLLRSLVLYGKQGKKYWQVC